MARLDSWDVCAYPPTWFDVDLDQNGWWDRDLVPGPLVPPPPPPPPPPKPVPKPVSGPVGGSTVIGTELPAPYRPPDWVEWLLRDWCPDDDEVAEERTADFTLLHVAAGAVVRALATGSVESFLDSKGRLSLVLEADDGTRYWYADLGSVAVPSGARVSAGQSIGRTKPGTAPIPAPAPIDRAEAPRVATGAGEPALLPPPASGQETAPPPAQVVFVEPPPAALPPATAQPAAPSLPSPAPAPAPAPKQFGRLVPIADPAPQRRIARLVPAPTPPRRIARLVPIASAAPAESVRPPAARNSAAPIVRMVAGVGAAVALVAALAALLRRPPPGKRRRRKRRKLGR